MRKLNLLEFEQFLNTICENCVLDENFYRKLKRLNFSPYDWPEIKAKKTMLEFMTIEEVKGFNFAQVSCGNEILKNMGDYIHQDPNQAFETYKYNIDCFLYNNLSMKLLKNPELGEQLLSDFKSIKKESVKLFSLKDSILPVMGEHMKNVKENRSYVSLPDFPILSKAIGGFTDSRVSIISAKSGMGKTKLAINLALSASKIMPTFYFNMEMSKSDFVGMFIQNKMSIKNDEWFDGSFLTPYSESRLLSADEKFAENDIQFTGGESLSINDITSMIHSKCKDAFIVIDYDQKIITQNRKDEWKEVLMAVVELEAAAKATRSHLILLAQGNEEGDIKSSSRSKQPTSVVLHFLKDNLNRFIIKSIKTRFAKPFSLEVSFDAARTQVSEIGLIKDEETIVNKKFK